MTEILPIFSSHYSLGGASIFTLDEAGKADPGNPMSVFDIAQQHGLKSVVVIDDRIDGFIEGVKSAKKLGIQFVFGMKMVCCADHEDKSEASRRTESKIVILLKNTQSYSEFLRIHNLATTIDFYEHHRTSWRRLKELWTPNLALAIPFFSGFPAVNRLKFSSAVPDFPVPANEVTMFREVDSGLPFAPIIDAAIDQFVADTGAQIQRVKSIYYPTAARFKSYIVLRCIDNRSTFSRPQVDHLASDRFSFEAWLKLIGGIS